MKAFRSSLTMHVPGRGFVARRSPATSADLEKHENKTWQSMQSNRMQSQNFTPHEPSQSRAQAAKRTVVLGSLPESLINFRGPLLRALVERGDHVVACAPDAPTAVRHGLRELGADYRNVPLERTGLSPLRDLVALLALIRLFLELRPNIVFSYTIKPLIYGSLAARIANVPCRIGMVTGVGFTFSDFTLGMRQRLASMVARRLCRISLKGNHRVFFQNPDDLELFRELRMVVRPGQASLVNGSGVDLEEFRPTSFPDRPVFLLIARLLRDKGIREYVEAARLIKAQHPKTVFRLVGWIDRNPTALAAEELQSWVDEGVIEYLGYLEDVRPAIAESSVYVLPSYREGTPRTVLEAMAMGRPIVTTDAPGCRETVRPGDNGFLVPVRDAKALADVMLRFIDKPALIQRMGAASRCFAEVKYDVRRINAVLLDAMDLAR